MKPFFIKSVLLASALLCAMTSRAEQRSTKVIFYSDSIVRIVKGDVPEGSFAVTMAPQSVKVKTRHSQAGTEYTSSSVKVKVDASGNVSFSTAKGKALVKEGGCSFTERKEGLDKGSFIVRQNFILDADEPMYGLGILQDGALSLRGKNRYMLQENQEDFVPIVQSIKGYGLFWDNTSPTVFNDDKDGMSFESEVGESVDYYFIWGGNADKVIAGIRQLTGRVPMLPLWTYGFAQSRERYASADQLLEVLHRYRELGVPLDCMVQDWQYWGNNYLWNAMEFLNDGFTKPQELVDEVHAQNAHMMISIWSSFGPETKQYRELKEKGLLLDFKTWPYSGSTIWPPHYEYPSGVRPYDPYSPVARGIYWKYLSEMEKLGIDSWWMDSTEPDHDNKDKEHDLEIMTSAGSFRRVRNAFPIAGVQGVYDNQRAQGGSKRVTILTRSAYAGQQRTGANTWSGDIGSSWSDLRKQIPAGLGFALTGNPNFNSDISGFFANSFNKKSMDGSAVRNPRFQELYVRWMQYGAFSPMMRSHGTECPREIYLFGEPGSPVYEALLSAIKLRYSLIPYIYSTAWKVSSADGTYQRALFMDFPGDRKTWEMNDEFMFGDAFLVAPVLKPEFTDESNRWTDAKVEFSGHRTRSVYLPEGAAWYEWQSNARFAGGQTVEHVTSFDKIPLYVRAGSIIPIGPDVQYTGEKPWDDLEIRVYAGADGSFTLYEDEGDGYAYEKGACSTIGFSLKAGMLTIGERKGSFPGMLSARKFRIVCISDSGTSTRDVDYTGKEVRIKL